MNISDNVFDGCKLTFIYNKFTKHVNVLSTFVVPSIFIHANTLYINIRQYIRLFLIWTTAEGSFKEG